MGQQVRWIRVSELYEGPSYRTGDEEIDHLIEDIDQHGILTPLLVKETPTGYEVHSGNLRLRAAKKLNKEEVPCVVLD